MNLKVELSIGIKSSPTIKYMLYTILVYPFLQNALFGESNQSYFKSYTNDR